MLEILTILSKLDRVSRVVDPDTFVAAPGLWGAIQSDGSIANCSVQASEKIHKMVISSASSNIYESHDIQVGRITTMESVGARCKVDGEGYSGTVNQGDMLCVSYQTTGTVSIGKLVSTAETAETGLVEVVARAEEVGTDYIVFKTVDPYTETLT